MTEVSSNMNLIQFLNAQRSKDRAKHGLAKKLCLLQIINNLVLFLLFVQVMGLKSQHGVQILIKGEKVKSKEPNPFDVRLSHKLLRENIRLEDLSPIDRKLLEYEQKIKFHRLDKGKQEIEDLRKMLDGVSVYEGF